MITLASIVAGLVGVILGGAVRAWEAHRARQMDAEALLSALVAEVEAITRLINHRQFIRALDATRLKAVTQVEAGHGKAEGDFVVIKLKKNYFSTYEASLCKIGLLHPYWADRITRFYTFVKAVSENYEPDSPFQNGVSAEAVLEITTNDLMLLHTIVVLGDHISAAARVISPPLGVKNPFETDDGREAQPALPEPQPALASAEAADGTVQLNPST